MTDLERRAIFKALHSNKDPSVPHVSLDLGGDGYKEVAEIIPGTPNHKLLDSAEFKAGYARAAKLHAEIISWLINPDTPKEDIKQFVGNFGKKK